MFEGNASYLYVANVARGTDTLAGMAAGSVAIVNEAGVVQTSTIMASNANYRVAQKLASGEIIFSPFFNPTKANGVTGKSYVAPTQQITYLGYNGSAGNLDAAAATDYVLNIQWNNTMGFYNNGPIIFTGAYRTATASQSELALGLLNSLDGVINRQPYKFVKIERVSNGSLADWTGAATSMTVTKGSKGVIYTNGSGVAAAGEALADGTIVFIAGATYKTVGTGTTAGFVLDSPYKGASAELAGGATYATQCGLATSVTSWGLKFTGVENSTFDAVNDTYQLTRFSLTSKDFVTAIVTNATAANEGSGYYKEIANREIYAQFLDKSPFISAMPRNNYRQETSASNTYDVMSFGIKDIAVVGNATGIASYKTFAISIATKVSLDGDGIDDVLGVAGV